MIILGIESSHDDTSIAIVENNYVIFNYKISQVNVHKQYGGTVPEIASREHYNNFYILLSKILQNYNLNKVDYIAYTKKPGLIGCLQMGKIFAHALSKILKKPLIPVNHLDGHIFSVLLTNVKTEKKEIKYPSIAFVVSGGHTNLYYLEDKKNKILIGQTLDDAAGEVFDKVARALNLGFPGGPVIDELFFQNRLKNLKKYHLTKPKLKTEFDFSFSGFKTQIINIIKNKENNEIDLIATLFEKTVIDYIVFVVKKAITKFKPKSLIISGGVSANKYLREQCLLLHSNTQLPLEEYTTDNGAMIAIAAMLLIKNK